MDTRGRIPLFTIVIIASLVSIAYADPGSRLVAPGVTSDTAPAAFAVRFETTKGVFVVEAYRPWAPQAVDRFYNLVRSGYFDGNLFYRVSPEGGVDFGINSDPGTTKTWSKAPIPCDLPGRKIRAGDLLFLNSGFGEGASTEIRIQTGADGNAISRTGAAALGRVVEGMEVFASLDSTHMQDAGKLTKLMRTLFKDGDAEARKNFPNIDSIVRAALLDRTVEAPAEGPSVAAAATTVPSGLALVRVYRPDASKRNFTLRIDGSARAALKAGAVYETTLPAGQHEFSTKVKFKMFATGIGDKIFASGDNLVAELAADSVYHVRSVPVGDGQTLQMYLVAGELGAEECKALSPAKQPEGPAEE